MERDIHLHCMNVWTYCHVVPVDVVIAFDQDVSDLQPFEFSVPGL